MTQQPAIVVVGIEVVQSIQNMAHAIPLLSGKRTAVRVYVQGRAIPRDIAVTGELEAVSNGGKAKVIASRSSVFLKEGTGEESLDRLREQLGGGLVFLLDGPQVKAGDLAVRLKSVTGTLNDDPELEIDGERNRERTVNIVDGPRLRLRIVGLRVEDPWTERFHMPEPGHGRELRSYLERSFPLSGIEASEILIDAADGFGPPYSEEESSFANPGRTWQENFDMACAHLMAVRARDVDNGMDFRTHYYGLVWHPDDFFIGAVSDVPAGPRPDVVALGPAEMEDGSYGAHEIAHALGRLHPGYCEGQRREDEAFPPQNDGRISNAADGHMGFDVGGASQNMRVLPYRHYHDFMTYCDAVWVSDYAYLGLLERLREEEALEEPAGLGKGALLQVVGLYGLVEKKGSFAYVFPTGTPCLGTPPASSTVHVAGKDKHGDPVFDDVPVELKRSAARDMHHSSGAFQVTVPFAKKLHRLELWVDGVRADTLYERPSGDGGPREKKVRISPPRAAPDDPYLLEIVWPDGYDRDAQHAVQARIAKGKNNWETVGVGITARVPAIMLDRVRFKLPPWTGGKRKLDSGVEVRIMRSNGFSEIEIYKGEPQICMPR